MLPRRGREHAGLLRGFLPVRCRGDGEVRFQLFLAKAQGAFVGFHLGEQPPQIGCFLSFHSAAPVKVDRLVGHDGIRFLRDLVGVSVSWPWIGLWQFRDNHFNGPELGHLKLSHLGVRLLD